MKSSTGSGQRKCKSPVQSSAGQAEGNSTPPGSLYIYIPTQQFKVAETTQAVSVETVYFHVSK